MKKLYGRTRSLILYIVFVVRFKLKYFYLERFKKWLKNNSEEVERLNKESIVLYENAVKEKRDYRCDEKVHKLFGELGEVIKKIKNKRSKKSSTYYEKIYIMVEDEFTAEWEEKRVKANETLDRIIHESIDEDVRLDIAVSIADKIIDGKNPIEAREAVVEENLKTIENLKMQIIQLQCS